MEIRESHPGRVGEVRTPARRIRNRVANGEVIASNYIGSYLSDYDVLGVGDGEGGASRRSSYSLHPNVLQSLLAEPCLRLSLLRDPISLPCFTHADSSVFAAVISRFEIKDETCWGGFYTFVVGTKAKPDMSRT